MLVKTINLTKETVLVAQKENKLLLRSDGTLWTIVKCEYNCVHDFMIMVQATNKLHRMRNRIEGLAKEFVVVDEINLNVDRYVIGVDLASTNYINENNKNNTETNLKVNNMEGYIERMIQEHKELVARINKLHAWVYGDAYKTVEPHEFANECIQLKAMKVYEEALRARLFNAGIKVAGTEYLVAIDSMTEEPEDGDTTNND